jgi:hypothetical protein
LKEKTKKKKVTKDSDERVPTENVRVQENITGAKGRE